MSPIISPVPSNDTINFTENGPIISGSEFSQSLPSILPSAARLSAPSRHSGLHISGHRVQALVDAINDIRGIGVDYLVDLPQLVLVGDESAGGSTENGLSWTGTHSLLREVEFDGSSR